VAISTDRIVDVGSIERLAESFEVSLRARNLSDRTIETYLEAVRLFTGFLRSAGMPNEVSNITREHVEAFLASELERVSPSSVSIRYRGLQQFFRWCVEDGEVLASPTVNVRPPSFPSSRCPSSLRNNSRRCSRRAPVRGSRIGATHTYQRGPTHQPAVLAASS
jgi:site-specific recombinase XerD